MTEIASLLLKDPRVRAQPLGPSLNAAAHVGNYEIIKLLLSIPELDPTAEGHRALRIAAQRDHVESQRLLLADPRCKIDLDQALVRLCMADDPELLFSNFP